MKETKQRGGWRDGREKDLKVMPRGVVSLAVQKSQRPCHEQLKTFTGSQEEHLDLS